MSEKYKILNPEGIYFATITVVYWIDLFERVELKHLIVDSLKFYQERRGLIIYAWCLMSSHLHLIVSSQNDHRLSDFFRDFKKFTNREIIKVIERINESRREWLMAAFYKAGKDLKRIKNFKVWQDGNHPIELFSNKFMDQKLEYVHNNPVEAEIVTEAHHYLYSSARDYAGIKGLLDVKFIE
jgi:REP element-mobilizing transposase RayT